MHFRVEMLVRMIACVSAVAGCGPIAMGTGDAGDAGVAGDVHVPSASVPNILEPRCAAADQAPIRTGMTTPSCTHVGPDLAPATAEWPAVMNPAMPVLYVRAGATGGDGSMAMPFGDIPTALAATPAAGTIVMARGEFMLNGPIALGRNVALVGAGPVMGTTLTITGTTAGLSIAAAAMVTVRGIALRYAGAAGGGVAIDLAMGATATLAQVAITGGDQGIRAVGGTLNTDGVSAQGASTRGIALTAGATGMLRNTVVRDGGGILVDASSIDFTMGFVTRTHGGMEIRNGRSGVTDRMSRVSLQCNERAGLTIDGAVTFEGSLLEVSGNTAVAGAGGDGLRVSGGARVLLDGMISSDADRARGSEFIANARAGILVAGANTAFEIRGAHVSGNAVTGMFVQDRASASLVGYSTFRSNTGAGLVATSGASIVSLQCNEFDGTRAGNVTTSAGTTRIGDAFAAADANGSTRVSGTTFTRNDGFALVFHGSMATLTGNTGTCNMWGVGSFGSMVSVDATNSIDANTPLPTSAPPHVTGMLMP